MTNKSSSPIILYGTRYLSPYIMLFGLYVIFHGHYSPGGGFQGGTLLAASLLIIRIASGTELAELQFKKYLATPLAAVGVIIYFGTGLTAVIMGGYFLDYEQLPLPGNLHGAELRYWGLLIIELGIGLTVMTVLTLIYDNMVNGEEYA